MKFPDFKPGDELVGNDTVQLLDSLTNLYEYWQNLPKRNHLHVVVQVPTVAPSNLPEYPILEALSGKSRGPPPFADEITFTIPAAKRIHSLHNSDISKDEVEVATDTPSFVDDFRTSLNRQRVISPNATGSSMLRGYLGDSFDTYFRDGTILTIVQRWGTAKWECTPIYSLARKS
ncbi:hypothetical protein B0F90DRAFT_358789 [Multifurca ochricompacta]|uniref:Uncharacterized protein n=1 Tax=Multifurca ochricompacta TaxID=376703 RepID=A0AAD4M5K2_9AGAM|nr:hypothetical protein B0F90DRAFT_358789 [Multifurca ochricompacta]